MLCTYFQIKNTPSDDGTTYSSELEVTMSTSLDRKEYSCVFTFGGESIGTDGSITSSKGKLVEKSK